MRMDRIAPRVLRLAPSEKPEEKCNSGAAKSTASKPRKVLCCTSPSCCRQTKMKPSGVKVKVLKPRVATEADAQGKCVRCGWLTVWGYPC